MTELKNNNTLFLALFVLHLEHFKELMSWSPAPIIVWSISKAFPVGVFLNKDYAIFIQNKKARTVGVE